MRLMWLGGIVYRTGVCISCRSAMAKDMLVGWLLGAAIPVRLRSTCSSIGLLSVCVL